MTPFRRNTEATAVEQQQLRAAIGADPFSEEDVERILATASPPLGRQVPAGGRRPRAGRTSATWVRSAGIAAAVVAIAVATAIVIVANRSDQPSDLTSATNNTPSAVTSEPVSSVVESNAVESTELIPRSELPHYAPDCGAPFEVPNPNSSGLRLSVRDSPIEISPGGKISVNYTLANEAPDTIAGHLNWELWIVHDGRVASIVTDPKAAATSITIDPGDHNMARTRPLMLRDCDENTLPAATYTGYLAIRVGSLADGHFVVSPPFVVTVSGP